MEELESTQQALMPTVAEQSDAVRATFIKKTYLHLALGILLFVIIEAIFLSIPAMISLGLTMIQGWSWLLVLLGYGLVTSFAENQAMQATSKPIQYAAFGLFVIAEAFLFVPLIYIAISITGDLAIVKQAGLLTLFLFTGISSVVLLTGKDFSMLKTFLSVGGVLALGLIVVGIAFGFSLGVWFSFGMVVLATAAILYQTSNILHKYHSEQYVAASLGLLGAFMLLFWYILDIVSYFSGD